MAGIAVASLMLAISFVVGLRKRRQLLVLAALFLASGLGHASLYTHHATPPTFQEAYWRTDEVEGRVVDAPAFWPGITYAQLWVSTGQGVALVRWSDPTGPVFPGQTVQFRGDATTLLGNFNFGLSAPEDYYRSLGVTHAVSVSGSALQVLDTPTWSLAYWLGRLRAWQGDLISRSAHPDTVPFLFAVWLGQRDRIEQAATQRYTDTGTAHMLSVSGLHVAIIYFSLEFLLAAFVRGPRLRAIIILVAVFAFAIIAGARPSTLRAAIVIAMYLSARLVNREPDAPTALGVSALLLLLWNPFLLRDAGALLSFASVASLLLYAEPLGNWLERRLHLPGRIAGPLAACLAVQVLTLPMSVTWFHVVSLSAPLANLVAVPLLDLVLWGCVGMVLAGGILPGLAELLGHAVWVPVAGIDFTVQWLAQFDNLSPLVTTPTTLALVCYYIAALLPSALLRPPPSGDAIMDTPPSRLLPRATTLVCIFLLVTSALLWRAPRPSAQVDVLDVGHGDAAVVFPPGGGALLIDGGDRSEYRDYGDSVVVPFLLAHGITRLDAIISTHPDRDHIGGLFRVLDAIPVDRVFLSGVPSGRPLEAGLVGRCREQGIPIERLGAGMVVEMGGARFDILHPPRGTWSDSTINNTSIVARLSWPTPDGEFSMLFPADIEASAEAIVADTACHSHILRVAHHGSATSSSAVFLDAVRPDIAIVSTRTTGRRQAMGPGVVERFEERGIPLWRTDLHGGLRIKGSTSRLLSARKERGW